MRHAQENKADVSTKNKLGLTPPFRAVSIGKETIFGLLLKNGAEINAKDAYGPTALLCSRTEAMFSILLENGANIDAKDTDGDTALHWIAKSGVKIMVQGYDCC